MAERRREHQRSMREFDREIGHKPGKIRDRSRVRISKGKKRKKGKKKRERGILASAKRILKLGWKAPKSERKGKKKRGNMPIFGPSLDPGMLWESATYIPGAVLGAVAAKKVTDWAGSWGSGWKGIFVAALATTVASGFVGYFVSRKHALAVGIGGTLVTVAKGLQTILGKELPGFEGLSGLSNLSDFAEVDTDNLLEIEPTDDSETIAGYDDENLAPIGSGAQDQVEDLAQLIEG